MIGNVQNEKQKPLQQRWYKVLRMFSCFLITVHPICYSQNFNCPPNIDFVAQRKEFAYKILHTTDSATARSAWHGGEKNEHKLTFYVGYIDCASVTKAQMLANIPFGIIPSNPNYIVEKNTLMYGGNHQDYVGPIEADGAQFSINQLSSESTTFYLLPSGTTIIVSAKLRRVNSSTGLWYSRKIVIR